MFLNKDLGIALFGLVYLNLNNSLESIVLNDWVYHYSAYFCIAFDIYNKILIGDIRKNAV